MSYSDLYFRSKRTSPLWIVAVVVLAVFSLFMYFSGSNSTPLQAVNKTLKRHELVNLTPHEAGVFWVSDKKETGWVMYGTSKDSIQTVAVDDRDVGEKKNSTFLHYVSLKGLKENQEYFYKIVSGNQVIVSQSQQPFSFKTPSNSVLTSSIKPAYGKVTLANGQPAQNAFVIYYYKNAYPFMNLTKLTGEWLIPLQFAIDKKTNQGFTMDGKEKVKIEILSENSANTVIDALVLKTNPLPQTIILGKNYKFLEEDNILPATTQRIIENKEYPVAINLPTDRAIIPGARPLLKGSGVPGKQVKIQINSKPGYISRITVDKKGEWRVEVPVSLPAGSYIMTVTTEDSGDKSVSLTRRFSIAKSGQQVLGVASPSAAITISPSVSPTIEASPSATPIITDTPTPTQILFTVTPISSPSSLVISGTPPGFDGNTVLFGSISLIIVGVGLMMVF